MIKRIDFEDGHSVELNSSIGWLIVYRSTFGRDILPDIMPVIESLLGLAAQVLGRTKKKELDVRDIMRALDQETISEIFITMSGMEVVTILNIIWAMAKKANPKIAGPETFFDEFEVFPLDILVPEVLRLIIESSISSKNAKSLLETIRSMRPSHLTS